MNAEELNAHIDDGSIADVILVTEAAQVKALSRIADLVCGRPGVRFVLIAGGSSAGKTTTAKRLVTQIKVNGRTAVLLSTDDYFVGDERNPRDENGELDYEHVDCVDIPALSRDINALLAGEEIAVRKFDFQNHCPIFDSGERMRLPRGGFVVLEGIHALNPRLTGGVADDCKFRIFVEPDPDFMVGDLRFDTYIARFLRRMVRDNQFRKLDPLTTFKLWPKVLEGEKKWIEPFVGNADVRFNSYLNYEIAVLKGFVIDCLTDMRAKSPENPYVATALQVLSLVKSVPASLVPGNSILRETIGGSLYRY